MYADTRAVLTWIDTTDPQTAVAGPRPDELVGPSARTFTATPTDNAGVSRVAFAIDGVFQGNDTTPGDGFTFTVNPNLYAHGSEHTLTAQAFDTAGRSDATPASVDFTVDRQTSTAITGPPADGHFQTAPQFTFTKDGDATATCSTLTGDSGDTSVHSAPCTASYTPQPAGDGLYRMRVSVVDAVGNTAQADRTLRIDDSDPNLTVSSPAEGARVKSPVNPAYAASDGQPGAVEVTCQYGSGAPAACGSKALPDGPATLTVKALDQAGNSRTVVRSFTVDSSGPAIAITGGPADGSIVRSTSVAFSWSASDGSQPRRAAVQARRRRARILLGERLAHPERARRREPHVRRSRSPTPSGTSREASSATFFVTSRRGCRQPHVRTPPGRHRHRRCSSTPRSPSRLQGVPRLHALPGARRSGACRAGRG